MGLDQISNFGIPPEIPEIPSRLQTTWPHSHLGGGIQKCSNRAACKSLNWLSSLQEGNGCLSKQHFSGFSSRPLLLFYFFEHRFPSKESTNSKIEHYLIVSPPTIFASYDIVKFYQETTNLLMQCFERALAPTLSSIPGLCCAPNEASNCLQLIKL
jgi:hypothetical protein